MSDKWFIKKISDIIEVNPKESLLKGKAAKKISMDILRPFCRDISKYEMSEYSGGVKFRNGDTIMARITPCLENGKTAKVNILDDDEVGFGSTEYIVFRAKKGSTDEDFVYYLVCSPLIRDTAIKSMVGSSGRQRVQTDVIKSLELSLPDFNTQKRIGALLKSLDDRISVNTAINENLHQLIAAYYAEIFKECEHTAKISDYADRVFSGGTPTTSNESYWSGEFKWLSSGETSQKYIVDTEKTITQAGVDNSSTRFAKKYATVIASAGQGHTRGQTSMLLTDTYINQSIIVVESERIFMPFIYWNICGRYEELRVISNSNSIRGSLTTKMISAFTAPKADITLISRFSELAWAAIHEIEKNCNEIVRLSALRDTLLPKLMNGEIDVSEVKI